MRLLQDWLSISIFELVLLGQARDRTSASSAARCSSPSRTCWRTGGPTAVRNRLSVPSAVGRLPTAPVTGGTNGCTRANSGTTARSAGRASPSTLVYRNTWRRAIRTRNNYRWRQRQLSFISHEVCYRL